MTTYHWLITADLIDHGDSTGVRGPRVTTVTREEIRKTGKCFRLLDGDNRVYYRGFYLGPDDETLFAPLDDFGTPNAGCTSIQYRNALGAWETL